jgi:hypothetical protein
MHLRSPYIIDVTNEDSLRALLHLDKLFFKNTNVLQFQIIH